MTNPSRMQVAAGEPQARRTGRVLPARRYRHPGDVIRLIAAAVVLAITGTIAALVPSAPLRPDAAAISGTGPGTAAGQVLTGLVQVTIAGAALVLLIAGLRRRRFRVDRDGGRRLRRGSGVDGCDHAPDRAGRPWPADGGPAAAFLAGGGGAFPIRQSSPGWPPSPWPRRPG